MEYASLRAFRADPEKVWSFYAKRIDMLTGAEPNEGHRAIAELEHRGLVKAVITQNIDLAYELARSAALMLVVGSALEVFPVADLPLETLRSGGSLAIVNRGKTP